MDPLLLLIELFLILCFLILYYHHLKSQENEPFGSYQMANSGTAPRLAANIHHFHDWATALLADAGCNLEVKGVPGQRYIVTCAPANVRHIFTSNFANYPKGHEYDEIFGVFFGAGILNSDGESWRRQRVKTQMLVTAPRFRAFTARCSRDKVEKSLLPFLAVDVAADEGRTCDLQDVFLRLAFDLTCTLIFGIDTGCLAIGLPKVPFMRATDATLQMILLRHAIPMACWKLMRSLDVGPERKMAAARRRIDSFVMEMVARARRRRADKLNDDESADLLSSFLCHDKTSSDEECTDDEFMRDTTVNLLFAGRDGLAIALSWFFYLVSKNPSVEQKLLGELSAVFATSRDGTGSAVETVMVTFDTAQVSSLVYLHAALCESLRLYPPIPFERKTAAAADVLPSGKELKAGDTVFFSIYSMGRMEGVWGKDCIEFRPERWITTEGKLRHEPSYKFFTFNTGPRTCLGKEMAFVQMKTMAAAVLWNFAVEVVPDHVVEPKLSIVLHMKNGLLVRVHRRRGFRGHE